MEPQFVTIPLSEYQQLLEGIQEISRLRDQLDKDIERLALDIAYDRQRLSKLEHPEDREPTPTEQAHLQRIEKHLKDSSRHAASFAELRGLLGVSPGRVSQLVRKLDPQRFQVKRSVANHKARVLVLKRRSSL